MKRSPPPRDPSTRAISAGSSGPPPARVIGSGGLRGCLACGEPVDGKHRVVTRGGVRVEAGTLVGPDLWQGTIPAGRDLSRLVAEVVFKASLGPRQGRGGERSDQSMERWT